MSESSVPFPPIHCPYREDEAVSITLLLTFLERGVLVAAEKKKELTSKSQSSSHASATDGEKLFECYMGYPQLREGPLASAIGELIYAYPFLTYSYKEVRLRFSPEAQIVVPTFLSDSQKAPLWLATRGVTRPALYVDSFEVLPTKELQVVAAWDRESFHFLRRTYSGVRPLPLSTISLARLLQDSLTSPHRVVHLLAEDTQIALSLCHRGKLLFSNSFERILYADCSDTESLEQQVLFFWTAMCQSLALESVVGDEIKLFLTPEMLPHASSFDRLKQTFLEMGSLLSTHSYSEL